MNAIVIFSLVMSLSKADPKPLVDNCPSAEQAKIGEPKHRTGAQAYQEVCAMCHGSEGKGRPGVFPPLAPSEWVADENILSNVILRGLAGVIYVGGERYASAMPSFHKELRDQEVLGIMQYLLEKNGKKSTFTVKQIATIRNQNVALGSVSSQAGLEELRTPKPSPSPAESQSFWKGCVSD